MFDFPASVASMDAVPEPYRALYAEKDGAYQLDETLARKLDVSGLVSALDKERKAARDNERLLKAWGTLGASPEEVAQRLGASTDAKLAAAQASGDVEAIRSQLAARHQGELAAKDAQLDRMRGALERQLIDAAAGSEIVAQRGAPALLLPHLRAALEVVEDEAGSFIVRVVDANGKPRLDERGRPLPVKDLVAELRQSEDFARAFDGGGLTGSGMPPNGAAGGMPGAFALTREQAKDPAAYRRARLEASRLGQLIAIVE